ncbi:hypothetical protein D3C80_1182390 [compost metagenome]
MRAGIFQRRIVTHNHCFGTFTLLEIIIECGNFHRQLRLGLMNALAIDPVVDLQQQIAFLDLHKVLHVNFRDIAVDLRADKRGLTAHVGVIRKLRVTGEWRQLPRIQNHQNTDDADRRRGKNGHHAQIIAGIGLYVSGILLTHNFSCGNAINMIMVLSLLGAGRLF